MESMFRKAPTLNLVLTIEFMFKIFFLMIYRLPGGSHCSRWREVSIDITLEKCSGKRFEEENSEGIEDWINGSEYPTTNCWN